jgi:DNA-3-methyladenine glycosylase I
MKRLGYGNSKVDDKMKRCSWCEGSEIYRKYHDEEWGVPVHDDRKHFEFLILEGAQAGLSWLTILKRREGYKKAFAGFDHKIVSTFDEERILKILRDPGVIRNKLKVRSAVTNASAFLEVQKEFGSFDSYIWSFVDGKPKINSWKEVEEIPATTELSDRVSKDLKERGFKFVGSTIIYAHLQATGIVNDHLVDCFRYREVQE